MKKYILAISALLGLAAVQSCDEISIDEKVAHEPVISSFTPASAPVGALVDVTGEYLNNVTEAYIGGVRVEIAEKVSNTRLSIRVVDGVTSGRLALVNPTGKGESGSDFTCSFAVPELTPSLIQASAEMGEEILLSGQRLNAVKKVYFTADGETVPHEAVIVNRSDDEMVVKVPYVENASAHITLVYSDGKSDVETAAASAPAISVIRYVPVFNSYTFERTAVGRSITLSGEYLGNVDRVMVGDWEAQVIKSANSLTFTVPAGDFPDGDTTVELKAWYFDNNESITLKDDFVVFVPFVKFWQDVQTWAQGRVPENSYASFFSPENGIVYANSDWKSVLDPVAMRLQNSQWGSANTPKPGVVSDTDYSSVVPYFFFSAVSGNVLQVNSPANSNSQIKNFFVDATSTPSNDFRVPGSNNNMPGTPILAFRPLSPDNATENALIQKVLKDEIDNINEELFPIDVDKSTIAGISVSSFAGGVKSDKFCDHQTSSLAADPGYKLDAVLLVAYYHNNGYNSASRAANIKRLGLIHIKQIDWGVYNNSNFGASCVTFDCYWQKYDYDYSKL